MRSIDNIEEGLKATSARLSDLKKELGTAKLAKYLTDAGVPDGARPIFAHNTKNEKVLIVGYEGYWPVGRVIKKDGSAGSIDRTIYNSMYTYVGEQGLNKGNV
jgi:hypothetical protein